MLPYLLFLFNLEAFFLISCLKVIFLNHRIVFTIQFFRNSVNLFDTILGYVCCLTGIERNINKKQQ
jgi:hypothetical protein